MSGRRLLWWRFAAGTGITAVCLVEVAPARPAVRLPWPPATALGACCGLLLFVLAARSRPLLPRAGRWPLLVAKLAIFGIWATNEEVLWRRIALGELLHAGVVPALAASTAGFALLHRARPFLHLGTGGVFGLVYVSTGTLAASIVAHWTYNVSVAALVERRRE
jgi:membrane protease YdiL (CAAX protease family)